MLRELTKWASRTGGSGAIPDKTSTSIYIYRDIYVNAYTYMYTYIYIYIRRSFLTGVAKLFVLKVWLYCFSIEKATKGV